MVWPKTEARCSYNNQKRVIACKCGRAIHIRVEVNNYTIVNTLPYVFY